MMKLESLEDVQELRARLIDADDTLAAFKAAPGDTVPAVAMNVGMSSPHAGRHRRYTVDLLPVPKHVAISAAERARSKVVDQLRQLGVVVADVEGSTAP